MNGEGVTASIGISSIKLNQQLMYSKISSSKSGGRPNSGSSPDTLCRIPHTLPPRALVMRAGRVPYRHTTRYYDLPYYVIVNYVVFICVAGRLSNLTLTFSQL